MPPELRLAVTDARAEGALAPRAVRYPAARWEHIEIVPGLEIHVRADGPEALRRLANQIYAHYGAAPQGAH